MMRAMFACFLVLLFSVSSPAMEENAVFWQSSLAAKTTAGASDDVVRLFHQGNLRGGQVSGTRALSTSPTSDLLHYNPQGQLFEFQVPRSTLNQWEQQGLMMRLQDLHAPSGIITPEIRILPPASEQMNQFIIKPPGG